MKYWHMAQRVCLGKAGVVEGGVEYSGEEAGASLCLCIGCSIYKVCHYIVAI